MKLNELVRKYKVVQTHFPAQFIDTELYCEHDTLYLYLDKPKVFSDKELEFLAELGLHTDDIEGSDNQVSAFYMNI